MLLQMPPPTPRFPLLMSVALGACLAAAQADSPPVLEIVKRMVCAEGQVALRGEQVTTLTSSRDGKQWVIREAIVLGVPRKERVETLAPEKYKGNLIVSDGQVRRRYFPGRKSIIETVVPDRKRFVEIKRRQLRLINANFEIKCRGTEQIAGRPAYVVELTPKRFEGGALRRWIDTKTFAKLKEERLSRDGKQISSKEFVKVQFGEPTDAHLFTFKPPQDAKVHKAGGGSEHPLTPEQLVAKAPFKVIVPQRLPGGFIYESGRLQQFGKREVAWLVYIDGLHNVSLFETPSKDHKDGDQKREKNRHLPRGAVTWDANGINFVLLGSLPRAHMETIRDALKK